MLRQFNTKPIVIFFTVDWLGTIFALCLATYGRTSLGIHRGLLSVGYGMEKDLVGDEITGYPDLGNLDQILEFSRKLQIQDAVLALP